MRAELTAFLAKLPYGRTLLTCTPKDIPAYLAARSLPSHAGSVPPSGQVVAVPKSLANKHAEDVQEAGTRQQLEQHQPSRQPSSLSPGDWLQ